MHRSALCVHWSWLLEQISIPSHCSCALYEALPIGWYSIGYNVNVKKYKVVQNTPGEKRG